MKTIKYYIPLLLIMLLVPSCTSIRVASDYDLNANFNTYKSFAFYKTGIDKAEISDLDKKRILAAIETDLLAKGFVKSETPDVLINIATKEKQQLNLNNNWGIGFGWGWGYNPWYWGHSMGFNNVSSKTVGSLYIDVIDANKKELVWQGKGTGSLVTNGNVVKKDAKIREFVQEILKQYPPIVIR